jgi:hypothetical protein
MRGRDPVRLRFRTGSELIVVFRQLEHARPDAAFTHRGGYRSYFGGTDQPMLGIKAGRYLS